jgi:hypothetical protein
MLPSVDSAGFEIFEFRKSEAYNLTIFESTMSDDSINDLFNRFGSLGLRRSKKKDEESLQDFLDDSGFGIFKVEKDLGYFGWTPSGRYKTLEKVTAEEILDQINGQSEPDELVDIQTINHGLPKGFLNLAPQQHINKYPYAIPLVAALHVSIKERDVQLDRDVDFCFGGSTLEMLATRTIEKNTQYFVTLVPQHPIVTCVVKVKEYNQNFSDVGFQFERLVTGKTFSDPHDESMVEHLQILEVGDYRVLFAADVDAQKDGHPVEVKTSNPAHWGTKTMFQMISSGSTSLCAGTKGRGTLTRVQLKSLSEVMQQALEMSRVSTLERNIREGMKALRREGGSLQEGDVMEIYFAGAAKALTLRPVHGKVLFPSKSVAEELL